MRQRITKKAKLRGLDARLQKEFGDCLVKAFVRGGTGHRVDIYGEDRDRAGVPMRYCLWPDGTFIKEPLNP